MVEDSMKIILNLDGIKTVLKVGEGLVWNVENKDRVNVSVIEIYD